MNQDRNRSSGALLVSAFMIFGAVEGQEGGPFETEKEAKSRESATDVVIRKLSRHRIVGLGEDHGLQEEHLFIETLVRDPRLPDVCDDIVIEFANSRYQATIDDFINGASVSIEELAPAWRNTSVSPFQQWQAPMYRQFFELVRSVNQGRESHRRIRVVAGGPPIDWSAVRNPKDHEPFLARSTHFAKVFEQEVLARGRRGLLIAGGVHLVKIGDATGRPTRDPGVGQTFAKKYPKELFVILPYSGAGDRSEELEAAMASWKTPSIIAIGDSPLSQIDAGEVFRRVKRIGENGLYNPFEGLAMDEICDAILWLGPSQRLTRVADERVTDDSTYYDELRRRGKLFGVDTNKLGLTVPQDPPTPVADPLKEKDR